MSTPKKGGKPIKITLTEGQLSDIISQTARTRRGLRAESLEDRIAPSVIGAPLDPSLVPSDGGDPIGDAPQDAPLPDAQQPPLPYDPLLPPTDPTGAEFTDPFAPTGSEDPTFTPPPDPFQPPLLDPNSPEIPPGTESPFGVPDPLGGPAQQAGIPSAFHGIPGAFGGSGGTYGGFPGEFTGDPGPFSEGGDPNLGAQRPFTRLHQPIGAPPELPGEDFEGVPPPEDGGATPSPEELEAHRRNILRQLRGGEPLPPPDAPPLP